LSVYWEEERGHRDPKEILKKIKDNKSKLEKTLSSIQKML